jgi:hypothetical protein
MPSPRKPVVYLLVIVPILIGGAIGISAGLIDLYTRLTGIPRSSVPRINGLLIALPAVFLWMPVTLLLSNCVLFVVPPLRKVANAYTTQTNSPSFHESQRILGKITLFAAVVCLPLIIVGFIV